jgi:hypothetical protein
MRRETTADIQWLRRSIQPPTLLQAASRGGIPICHVTPPLISTADFDGLLDATNAAPVDNRGSSKLCQLQPWSYMNRFAGRPTRAQTVYPQTQAVHAQPQTMQPQESKHRKKTKGKDGRTKKHRHEAEEVSSEDELAFTPITRSTTF